VGTVVPAGKVKPALNVTCWFTDDAPSDVTLTEVAPLFTTWGTVFVLPVKFVSPL
jgi:hypothetical protein